MLTKASRSILVGPSFATLLIVLTLASDLSAAWTANAKWRWISSTDSQRWLEQPELSPHAADVPKVSEPADPVPASSFPPPEQQPREKLTIVIDPNATAQPFNAWGGCFNELGWRAMLRLDEQERQRVLRALFDEKEGLGFNVCRLPIGASDFALSAYSLDDVAGDYELKHFSIERDQFMLIPYIRAALSIRPDLKLWASPWSPPAWMKTSGTYHGGSLKQDSATLKSYATYLARFVEAYQAEGINISQVHFQNEPAVDNKYPTCLWPDATSARDFLRDYAAPIWSERKVPAELWFGTITNSNLDWFQTVLDDPKVIHAIGGAGLQYESRKIAAALHAAYPDLPLMETETRCFNGANSWAEAEETFASIQQFIRGGCGGYMYWNMILDETGRSSWGWSQDSTIVISQYDGSITYTPQYFLMKHLSRFVKPGSHFLKPTVLGDPLLAFKTSDGSTVAVITNKSAFEQAVELHVGNQAVTVSLPPHSFNSFLCGN